MGVGFLAIVAVGYFIAMPDSSATSKVEDSSKSTGDGWDVQAYKQKSSKKKSNKRR